MKSPVFEFNETKYIQTYFEEIEEKEMQLPEKLPETESINAWITWTWVVLLSLFGGLVGYLEKLEKKKLKHSLFLLTKDLVTSAFVGIMTFMLCDLSEFSWQLTAAMVGISGHMGTRLMFKLEEIVITTLNLKK